MATLHQVRKAVTRLNLAAGAPAIYVTDDGESIDIVANPGWRLKAGGHLRCSVYMDGAFRYCHKAEAYQDVLEGLAYGVEPCDDPECEWCQTGGAGTEQREVIAGQPV